jgi:hypothetical protein
MVAAAPVPPVRAAAEVRGRALQRLQHAEPRCGYSAPRRQRLPREVIPAGVDAELPGQHRRHPPGPPGAPGRPLYRKSVTPALAAFPVRATAREAVIADRCTSMPVSTGPRMSASGRVPVGSACSNSTCQPASWAARAQYSVCRLCSSLIGAGSRCEPQSPAS